MANPVLPPRPLRVRFGFALRAWAITVFATLIGIGIIWVTATSELGNIHQIRADEALWSRGVSAESGGVKGQDEHGSHIPIFHSYTLTATYKDASGEEHSQKISFDTWFQSVHKNSSSFDIRYDPKNPDHCVVSWAIDVKTGRWVDAIGWLLLGSLLGLGIALYGLFGARDDLKAAKRAAKRSDEVRLRVTKVVAGSRDSGDKKKRTYYLETEDGKTMPKVSFKLPRKPLFADAAGKWVVALACPDDPGKPVVLGDHFAPFALHRQQAEEVRQRLSEEVDQRLSAEREATPQG